MKFILNRQEFIFEKSIGSEAIRNKHYSNIDKKVFYSLVNLDPTSVRKKNFSKPGKYTKWLLIQYKKHKKADKEEQFINMINDEKFRKELNKYLFIFSTNWFKSESKDIYYLGGERNVIHTSEIDILKYKTIYSFMTEIRKYEQKYELETEDAKFEVVYSDDKIDILIPINFTASYELAKNTQWCSQSYAGYSMWNKRSILFRIVPKDDKNEIVKLTWGRNYNEWSMAPKKYPELNGEGSPFEIKKNGKENWENLLNDLVNEYTNIKDHFNPLVKTMSLVNIKAKREIEKYRNKIVSNKEEVVNEGLNIEYKEKLYKLLDSLGENVIKKICDELGKREYYTDNFIFFKKDGEWYVRVFHSLYPDVVAFEDNISHYKDTYEDILSIIDVGKVMKKINEGGAGLLSTIYKDIEKLLNYLEETKSLRKVMDEINKTQPNYAKWSIYKDYGSWYIKTSSDGKSSVLFKYPEYLLTKISKKIRSAIDKVVGINNIMKKINESDNYDKQYYVDQLSTMLDRLGKKILDKITKTISIEYYYDKFRFVKNDWNEWAVEFWNSETRKFGDTISLKDVSFKKEDIKWYYDQILSMVDVGKIMKQINEDNSSSYDKLVNLLNYLEKGNILRHVNEALRENNGGNYAEFYKKKGKWWYITHESKNPLILLHDVFLERSYNDILGLVDIGKIMKQINT